MNDRLPIGHVATAILIVGLLYVARPIFIQLAFALFLIALTWPMQAKLQRWLPKVLAMMLTLGVTAVVIIVAGSMITWGVGKLAQWLLLNAGRLQVVYVEWAEWLDSHGIAVVAPIMELFNVSWLISVVQGVAGRLHSLAGSAMLVFVLVMLGLLEVGDFSTRLQLSAAQPYGQRILAANREIARKLQRYMVVRTIASILTGATVWAVTILMGLELAAAWAAMAFTLNYIPFLGPLVATLLPAIFAIVQFESWQMAVLVLICLSVIQFVIGSYLEPLLAGTSLNISPFAVIFAVFFWSFLWGIAGAFIGIPILIAFVVYCAQSPSSRWLAAVLSVKSHVMRS